MARSYKKQRFFYIACGSPKFNKKEANKLFRRKTKQALHYFDESINFPHKLKEVSDVWTWNVDGPKYYWAKADPKYMRK